MLTKAEVAGMVAAVADDSNRHRYRLLHRLVCADGLGAWQEALTEVLTVPSLSTSCPKHKSHKRTSRSASALVIGNTVVDNTRCWGLTSILAALAAVPLRDSVDAEQSTPGTLSRYHLCRGFKILAGYLTMPS
jgi:hypothetical protein